MTAALKGGEWSAARPGRTLPPGKSRYPFYRRLGGHQGRSGRTENLVPTGNRSRIVQPIVSPHTDWATPPPTPTHKHTMCTCFVYNKSIPITFLSQIYRIMKYTFTLPFITWNQFWEWGPLAYAIYSNSVWTVTFHYTKNITPLWNIRDLRSTRM